MIDVKLIRENPDGAKQALKKRNRDGQLVDDFLSLDERWRLLTKNTDGLRAQQNILSRERKVAEAKTVKLQIKSLAEELSDVEQKRKELLGLFPNIPADDVPVGRDQSENVLLREVGGKPMFGFPPKDYLTIGESMDIIDVKNAAQVAGSRFGYLKGLGAILELALVNFAVDKLVKKGFIFVIPPAMIRPEVFAGMGRLAAEQKEERYYLPKDDLYLIGSAEHSIGPMHMGQLWKAGDLPRRYVGFSTCFRREAGSYGKDTKGILRVHQFDKVEMFSFTKPEDSDREQQFLLGCQEELMKDLQLPYRVMEICTGDLGWTDAKQFDIETWLPSQNQYRETQSCSNTTDFQARGIHCRYEGGGYVHMLNGTALAIGRTIIAIIENNQNKTGTFDVPEVLKKFVSTEATD
jgi:seryl-tRNA synthetase